MSRQRLCFYSWKCPLLTGPGEAGTETSNPACTILQQHKAWAGFLDRLLEKGLENAVSNVFIHHMMFHRLLQSSLSPFGFLLQSLSSLTLETPNTHVQCLHLHGDSCQPTVPLDRICNVIRTPFSPTPAKGCSLRSKATSQAREDQHQRQLDFQGFQTNLQPNLGFHPIFHKRLKQRVSLERAFSWWTPRGSERAKWKSMWVFWGFFHLCFSDIKRHCYLKWPFIPRGI